MKYSHLFLLVVIALLGLSAKQKIKTFTVSGTITQTSDYCGGAAPSEAMLEMLRTPQVLEGKKIFVRKGNANDASKKVITETVSDANGNFKLDLFPGVYCIVFEEKSTNFKTPQNDKYNTWDAACLKAKYVNCEYTFTLKSKSLTGVKINYHKHCPFKNPCSQYSGPTPP
jgi:hypothetical protein